MGRRSVWAGFVSAAIPVSGMTGLGVRWYNPVTGRFTTPDPSVEEKNTYLYTGGNCCHRVDPMGEAAGLRGLFEVVTGEIISVIPKKLGFASGPWSGRAVCPGLPLTGR